MRPSGWGQKHPVLEGRLGRESAGRAAHRTRPDDLWRLTVGEAPHSPRGCARADSVALPALRALRLRRPRPAPPAARPLGLAAASGCLRRPGRALLAVDPCLPTGVPLACWGCLRRTRALARRRHGLLSGWRHGAGADGSLFSLALRVLAPRTLRRPGVLRGVPRFPGALAADGARGALARPDRCRGRPARRARRRRAPHGDGPHAARAGLGPREVLAAGTRGE